MIGFIKKLFGAKDTAPAPTPVEAPYKIDTSSINPMSPVAVPVVEAAPSPEAVVVVPEAVVPAAVVEQTLAKKPAPKKQQPAKKPAASKTATAKAPPKSKASPKPKAKPAA